MILLLAFGFHAYWAAGGEWGAATAYGSPRLPPQAITAVVAILIAGAALLLLARIGQGEDRGEHPGAHSQYPPRQRGGQGSGVSNLIQPQDGYARDWHNYFFGPLLMILAALCAIAARSKPPR